jgi:hypothetical protein
VDDARSEGDKRWRALFYDPLSRLVNALRFIAWIRASCLNYQSAYPNRERKAVANRGISQGSNPPVRTRGPLSTSCGLGAQAGGGDLP